MEEKLRNNKNYKEGLKKEYRSMIIDLHAKKKTELLKMENLILKSIPKDVLNIPAKNLLLNDFDLTKIFDLKNPHLFIQMRDSILNKDSIKKNEDLKNNHLKKIQFKTPVKNNKTPDFFSKNKNIDFSHKKFLTDIKVNNEKRWKY